MAVVLGPNRYGKAETRVVRVTRDGEVHRLKDCNVSIALSGDMEGAQALLKRVKYPNLLYKPVRSSYYMLRGNLSTMTDDLDGAEADLRKGLSDGLTEKEYEGTAYLQLGSIACALTAHP